MSKIVQVINAMIVNPDKIKSVIASGAEYFFLYNKKYKWSIVKNDEDDYIISYYPDAMSLEEVAHLSNSNWQNLNFIKYATSDIRTREAEASFAELYTLVSEKAYGIDEVFKDIISDLEDDFPF